MKGRPRESECGEARQPVAGQRPDGEGKCRHMLQRVGGIVCFLALLAAMFALGHIVAQGIFELTDAPPPLAGFLVSVGIGLAIFAFVAAMANLIMRAHAHSKQSHRFGEDILIALDRISHGDFDVFIAEDDFHPLGDVVESVNRMARELGTLENNRQEFITNVSHEMQSPLTSISGFAELLRDPTLSEDRRAHYLDIISSECRRLSRLSDNLLRLTSLDGSDQELERYELALDEQLASVVLMLEPQWAAKLINVSLDGGRCTVCANGELLEQVWINILHNAIKFTPDGGRIGVCLSADDTSIIVTCADNGCGISEGDMLHIFERFYRADRARDRSLGGNGLGLPLAKRIIELHGGNITATSTPGQGTTVTVTLPTS